MLRVRCRPGKFTGQTVHRRLQPIGMLGHSSGHHDWLLANAIACVSCGFHLRNARNASDCVWMETGLSQCLADATEAFSAPLRTPNNPVNKALYPTFMYQSLHNNVRVYDCRNKCVSSYLRNTGSDGADVMSSGRLIIDTNNAPSFSARSVFAR